MIMPARLYLVKRHTVMWVRLVKTSEREYTPKEGRIKVFW
jgi:hypothetical protein